MDDPTRRSGGSWPQDRPIRWGRVAGSLTWFVVATLALIVQILLALPIVLIVLLGVDDGRVGPIKVVLSLVWCGLTLFAAWSMGRWWIVVTPILTVAAILLALAIGRPSTPPVSGPFLIDSPAGVVDGVEYRPDIDPADFSTTISNPYLPLVPGTSLTYEGGGERVVVTVTSRTRRVMGVEAVVVRDRASRGGSLIEDTEDWFAQDDAGNVWYFGEDTAECRGGEIASRHGAWEAGVGGAQPGIVMLARPRVGDYYRQEYFRGQAEDVARVRELGVTVEHDGTTYREVLVTEDFTALEPGQLEHKLYAPEVGLIEERRVGGGSGGLRLVEVMVDPGPNGSATGTLCQG